MNAPSRLSDAELITRMPEIVLAERSRSADVIEHLCEIDRRRLYLDQACRSLSCYCIERLGYSEDEAAKRVTAARLVSRFPLLLAELRTGTIHLTGICMLAPYLTTENYEMLVGQARGKSKRELEEAIAASFPKPDVPPRVCSIPQQTTALALASTGAAEIRSGTTFVQQPSRVQSLSVSRWAVQFTASAELHEKMERARELLSHAIPSGDLGALFERALDELIAKETKRRLGAGKPRKRRALTAGSRHVPVEVARQIWERDGGQCAFVDEQGRRCSARRFLTIEHLHPFALGGPPTVENACLLCSSHNQASARSVFGDGFIETKAMRQRAYVALRGMGFSEPEVRRTLDQLNSQGKATEVEALLRAALELLVPVASVTVS
jgi:hypothetical protein